MKIKELEIKNRDLFLASGILAVGIAGVVGTIVYFKNKKKDDSEKEITLTLKPKVAVAETDMEKLKQELIERIHKVEGKAIVHNSKRFGFTYVESFPKKDGVVNITFPKYFFFIQDKKDIIGVKKFIEKRKLRNVNIVFLKEEYDTESFMETFPDRAFKFYDQNMYLIFAINQNKK